MVERLNRRRRRFLTAAATAAAGSAAPSCVGRRGPWRFFTREEAATAGAVCERLIPTDEYPGAAWAGAVNFLDRQLVGPYRRYQKLYRDGLAGVEQSSRILFSQGFTALAAPRQVEVLKAMEGGKAPGDVWKRVSARQFFSTLLAHTMQSYYGDPRHGGNRDAVSWRMLGIPLAPVRGREQHDLTQSEGARSARGNSL